MAEATTTTTTIVWFRRDLRLGDHPALAAAAARGAVVPVFIWAPEEEGAWPPGGASRWWLHHSLRALGESLAARGSRLIFRRGPSAEALAAVAAETGASAVCWSRLPEPAARGRDDAVEARLRARPLKVARHDGNWLFAPGAIRNTAGDAFSVFTPFWRACLAGPPPAPPLPAPARLASPGRWPTSVSLDDLGLDPRHPWTDGLARAWTPGEAPARARLRTLLRHRLADYPTNRDRPALDGTSTLSPHLHHGEISARQIWQALADQRDAAATAFRRELGWREFAHHALDRFPHLPERSVRPEPGGARRRPAAAALRAWQRGRTGYPLVDAGMRQLWATGWMHNRVRMVVASFLVKHLLAPWREGARWFWDALVDADLANNSLNWQWVAGTGFDAAPYYRIFNPAAQSRKFDPGGDYLRRWVPELAALSDREIHQPPPGKAPGYPEPMIDHHLARARVIAALRDR